ncbi:hypothetical protein [Streptomyces sp. NPDC004008]
MRPDLQALAHLSIDPAQLQPAPAGPLRATGFQTRIHPGPSRRPCSACGQPAVATRIVDVPGLGLRWHDSCRDCMIAGFELRRP